MKLIFEWIYYVLGDSLYVLTYLGVVGFMITTFIKEGGDR